MFRLLERKCTFLIMIYFSAGEPNLEGEVETLLFAKNGGPHVRRWALLFSTVAKLCFKSFQILLRFTLKVI